MNRSKYHPEKRFKLNAIALAIASFASANAISEEQTDVNLGTMEVVGQTEMLDRALNEQRNSNSIKSVIESDGISQLPDDNVAEAVKRLPGVSVQNDQGEGRFVSVRGLAPTLNNVTINGTNIPSPEDGTRAVALDVLPSELVQSIAVVKTLTPDMDANSLGGTVEINTLSAFDHDGQFYTMTAEGGYDDNTEETSPKVSGAYSDIFELGTGKLGVAAALSWEEREFGSDNVETGGKWDFEDGALLEETEMRRYDIERERLGLGLNFDYQADANSKYYLRTLYSEFTDTETRQATGVEFADAIGSEDSADGEAYRELKDREETQTIQSYVLGGEKIIGSWTVTAEAGYSRSEEDTPAHIPGAKFEGSDDFTGTGYSSSRKPTVVAGDSFFDASQYELDSIEWEEQNTTDTEKNIKLDLAKNFMMNGFDSELKFGGKLSRRTKENDQEAWEYEDFGDADTSLSAFSSGNVDYGLGRFGPKINTSSVKSLLSQLDKDDAYNEEDSIINDFEMNEDIDSAYVMDTVDLEDWTLIAGVRYEHTDFTAKGTGLNEDDEFESINKSNSYSNWLPGLHARYYMNDDTQVRAAWTNSVVRPTFEALAPGFVRDGEEAEFGNPDLDPMESSNFDLGIEHFMGRASAISAFVFYKDIKNFVYNTDIAGTGAFEDYDEAVTFENGDSAEVYGIEISYTQKFDWLPSPWNGLLVGVNATFSDSDAEVSGLGVDRDISLPGQSDTVGNVMVGWENDKLSMRLAANYTSEYLYEIDAIDDADHDSYVDEQTFVDFTAGYFITKNMLVRFEAKNITDEEYYVYSNNQKYNTQYEEYGPSYKLSLTLTNF